ncbi:MAG: hypothetical protein K9K66_19095 [Desulfarculaceae bacterium]|nr:hypothetical protein [Desulfarculaceae bacterium]MCF8074110.1 hypothetical protein [Desulfarculaceae bacterium]MCF8103767.1 hypothetical protein [Desulfarculaceae bacterium]MCF8116844.1 hypothetical protein [Desulfarculaceae bacterium]
MRAARLLTCFCLAALLLAAAWPAGAEEQEFFFRVLDSRDRPVPTAILEVEPLAGKPENAPPFKANEEGVIRLPWTPQVKRDTSPGGDEHINYLSALRWRVIAPDHLSAVGASRVEDQSRKMADPLLAKLSRKAKFSPQGETVVLRTTGELFAFPVPKPPQSDPLVKACLDFRRKNALVALRLGARFAWPAFNREDNRLDLLLDWVGAPWGDTAPAPLMSKVTLFSGLPLMIAAGQDLPPIKGIDSLRLTFYSNIFPAGDEHAMPIPARVVIEAPLDQIRRLARGEMRAGAFLAQHPPRLEVDH